MPSQMQASMVSFREKKIFSLWLVGPPNSATLGWHTDVEVHSIHRSYLPDPQTLRIVSNIFDLDLAVLLNFLG